MQQNKLAVNLQNLTAFNWLILIIIRLVATMPNSEFFNEILLRRGDPRENCIN